MPGTDAEEISHLHVDFAQLSDVGKVRDHNEDAIGHVAPQTEEQARQKGWLFVLADGVGGCDRGEVASQMTVDRLTRGFREATTAEAAYTTLQRLIQRANLDVYEAAMSPGTSGKSMATTVVTCIFRFDRMTVGHVGDSRCYLLRHGRVDAVTRDHTVVQDQVRMGLMSVRDAQSAQHAGVLSRSVGSDMIVNPEVQEEQVFPGDIVVLCSDGLHHSITERDLDRVVARADSLHDAAAELVDTAKQRDGNDNISVQLIRVNSVERVGMYRGRHYKLR